jgi:DNA-binding winged helix-turn-helix (wHTH) protein
VTIRFDEFELDPQTRLLTRAGQALPVTPKAFRLLELLLSKRPAVVSKNEILDSLWPDAYVAEANVPNLVAELRAVLNDSARRPRYLRTAHGAGYAFSGAAIDHHRLPVVAEGQVRSACWLVGEAGSVQLLQGDQVLGRGPDCDLPVPGPSVSRRHARVSVRGAEATIEDLGSRNGTFVRGRRITGPESLNDGDEVRLGDVWLRFRASDPDCTTDQVRVR